MEGVNKWFERIYEETDFGRSIATSVAGLVGLLVYLLVSDWVIAAFSAIIAFPIVRVVSTGVYERVRRRAKKRVKFEEAESIYDQLSPEEQDVVMTFVDYGGCVLTWSQMNNLPVLSSGIESLVQREVLWTSMTIDGMRETFVLDEALFDVGQQRRRAQ